VYPRLCISDTYSIDELAVKAGGLWGLIQSFVKRNENAKGQAATDVEAGPALRDRSLDEVYSAQPEESLTMSLCGSWTCIVCMNR
jgi:hypothetical protein